MMEEYSMKKRMKKTVRNDFKEDEDFFEILIDENATKKLGKKQILVLTLIAFVVFCCLNRRKGGKNSIILVKHKDDDSVIAENEKNRKRNYLKNNKLKTE